MNESLPEHLRSLFWDVDFDQLRVEGHERYVIERVLEYGDDEAIRWLRRTFSSSAIADTVRRSRRISRRTANLWALVLDIPRDQIRCFSKRSLVTSDIL
jgi:hypothetical protein